LQTFRRSLHESAQLDDVLPTSVSRTLDVLVHQFLDQQLRIPIRQVLGNPHESASSANCRMKAHCVSLASARFTPRRSLQVAQQTTPQHRQYPVREDDPILG
jgi:hypothetical protein